MSLAATIREWLKTQDGPRTIPEIVAGIGESHGVGPITHRMYRDGILSRTGRCRFYAFAVIREPVAPIDSDERRRRKAERERARRRRMGLPGRTWAEYMAECKQRSDATRAIAAKRKAEREAMRRIRDIEKAARKARREAARKPKPRPVLVLKDAPPAPVEPPRETVESFLRRGGRIDHLEPFAVSQPLRRIKQAA